MVQLNENRKREGEPTCATVWQKGEGRIHVLLWFGLTGVGRGRRREPMHAMVQLNEDRGGKKREPICAMV